MVALRALHPSKYAVCFSCLRAISGFQVKELGPPIILANTYHLANQPGKDVLEGSEGLHNFMKWEGNLLTDSGGFQMVSLTKKSTVTEEGVQFNHPITNSPMLLTPESSIEMQV
eukprot:Selendium_serpulae@DN5780_c0_g1_i10.p2